MNYAISTYADVLQTVVENGRVNFNQSDDIMRMELAAEIEYECIQVRDWGEDAEETGNAIEYAMWHISR